MDIFYRTLKHLMFQYVGLLSLLHYCVFTKRIEEPEIKLLYSGSFRLYLLNSSTLFVYIPLVVKTILMSVDYATFNENEYHCRRITRMLLDERIQGT